MIHGKPSEAVTTVMPADSPQGGLLGKLTFAVTKLDGTIVQAASSVGITVDQENNYRRTFVLPAEAGDFLAVWVYPNLEVHDYPPVIITENIVVTAVAASPELDYAQVGDLDDFLGHTDYLPTFEAKVKLLAQCERDLDLWAGGGKPDNINNNKRWDPINNHRITPYQKAGLNRAACAQAEYRLTMGEEFFIQPPDMVIQGPDFTQSGCIPRIAPKAIVELRTCRLIRPTARGRA